MVLQKRLDYGFNGYQVPPTPRATRSARRRSAFKKKVEENQMCAFELLATVAGKLLLEGECSPASSNASTEKDQCAIDQGIVKREQGNEEPLKLEPFEQRSCDRKFFDSELVSQVHEQNCSSKEFPSPQNDCHSGFASLITTSDCSEKFGTEKLVIDSSKNEMGSFSGNIELGSSMYREPSDCKLNSEIKKQIKDELLKVGEIGIGTGADTCSADDRVVWDEKPPALVSSDSSAKVPLCSDHMHDSFLPNRDEVNVVSRNVVSRDDDENSSGCTHPSTTTKFLRSPSRIGDRRIRKLLASKYWKQSPKRKDEELSKTVPDGNLKQSYRNRKNSYKRLRSPRNYPFKKRKFFDCSSVSNSDERISSEGIIYLPEKSNSGDAPGLGLKMHGGKGTSISVAGQHPSFQSKDSHVKLRIKSFRVPELFIEIPETATVGSLKRTVLEAVTTILGNGLRVGVLLQGKKVRDDNKTLLQTGISHDNQLDTLGFTLEPSLLQTSAPLSPGDSFMIPCDTPQPLKRFPPAPTIVHQGITDALHEPHVTNLGNSVESDNESVPSPTDRNMRDCKALVAVPAISVEALAVVPMHRKSKRSEIVQRRIRRPFSVAEVEALVQAVEKLGTGRWRDVKLRAFDNAKHRTYVDLKDKWKTLVHTARISPQQRRGEPVPQELLDRVLTAHAYWSQQQARQQLKQQQSETCLL